VPDSENLNEASLNAASLNLNAASRTASARARIPRSFIQRSTLGEDSQNRKVVSGTFRDLKIVPSNEFPNRLAV